MRSTTFLLSSLLLLAGSSSLAAPAPAPVTSEGETVQVPLAMPYLTSPRTVTFTVPSSLSSFIDWADGELHKQGDDDDICPKMKVSCVKDGKTVGDIGKKPFCRNGVTCGQCHQTENTAECNAKFLTDCKAQCEAQGPLGGTGKNILAEWFA